jgi:hypothetical protein
MQIFFALLLLTAVTLPAQDSSFYWDMENAKPNLSPGDSTPYYFARAARSDSFSHSDRYALRCDSAWASVNVENPTNNNVWAPVTQGTVELYWKYVAPWNYKMIFSIGGKSSNRTVDTDDGCLLKTRGGDVGVFTLTYGWNNFYSYVSLRAPAVTMVDGQWYRFRIKYRVGGNPSLSLQVNDLPPATYNDTLGATACLAWHQVLIGNDLNTSGVEYIDDVKIWPMWMDDISTGITPLSPATLPTGITVTSNPVRDRIEFVLPAGQTAKSLAIYNHHGRLIAQTSRCGVSSWANAHAPAGLYFYTLQTNQGTLLRGSFIKINAL